jgi:diguanylate cyclase (GGDEF)-like protein
VALNEEPDRADASEVHEVDIRSLVDQWRCACTIDEDDSTDPWPVAESAALLECILAAGRSSSAFDPDTVAEVTESGDRFSALDRATRSWARMQTSLPTIALRLSHLRDVLGAEGDDEEGGLLDTVRPSVVTTAHEEFTLRLQHAALTDPLTETGNRRALENAWQTAVAQGKRGGRPTCLVAIDLDGLKRINDFQGHAAGDEAIVGLCQSLRAALRSTDEVFRIGGDEFVALLPGTAAPAAVELLARVAQFNAPKFSWGAADTVQDGTTLDAVLACADRRLYAQRRRSRPATTSVSVARPGPAPSFWSRFSPTGVREMAVTGVLALAIGAIVVSISGGNHSLCAAGVGPAVVDCGLSNAVYYGGMILMAAGGIVFGVGVIARALGRGIDSR